MCKSHFCPCCSNQMQRYVEGHRVYWFCRHCWLEMPDFDQDEHELAETCTTQESTPVTQSELLLC